MVTIDERQAFADRLNLVLDEKGFPPKGGGRQIQLAKDWGLSQKGVRKWLEGESIPETARLIEMAKRYQVSFEWLATGRNPITLQPSSQIVGSISVDASTMAMEILDLRAAAKRLIDAVSTADKAGLPTTAFEALHSTLRVFEDLRDGGSDVLLDINAPDPEED